MSAASPREAAGSDARVGCEPGQVRKEAALSRSGPVPSCPRSSSAAMRFFMRLFIVANPAKAQAALDGLLPWLKSRAEVVGVDSDCRADLRIVDADVVLV